MVTIALWGIRSAAYDCPALEPLATEATARELAAAVSGPADHRAAGRLLVGILQAGEKETSGERTGPSLLAFIRGCVRAANDEDGAKLDPQSRARLEDTFRSPPPSPRPTVATAAPPPPPPPPAAPELAALARVVPDLEARIKGPSRGGRVPRETDLAILEALTAYVGRGGDLDRLASAARLAPSYVRSLLDRARRPPRGDGRSEPRVTAREALDIARALQAQQGSAAA